MIYYSYDLGITYYKEDKAYFIDHDFTKDFEDNYQIYKNSMIDYWKPKPLKFDYLLGLKEDRFRNLVALPSFKDILNYLLEKELA